VTDAPPTCQNTSTTTKQDTPVDINDLFVTNDPDDDNWSIRWTDGQHGVTDDQGTTYFPDPGFVGTDQIPFHADDGALTSQDCTITITVTAKPVVQPPPPPPPVVQPPPPSPPPPPVDVTKPLFSAALPKQSLKNASTKGIKLASTSNEAGTLVVTIKVDKKTARTLKIDRRAKRAVAVGTLTQAIAAGDSTVTVKLTKKAGKAFKRARKVKLLITMSVTDAAGNATTRSMTVTLKR
jgi:Bacterial Ig domain